MEYKVLQAAGTMIFRNILAALALISSTTSALGQSPYYSKENSNWANRVMQGEVHFSMYLIGDAGHGHHHQPSALDMLSHHLHGEQENSAVVFLGDNSYPRGLPEEGSTERDEAESQLLAQTNVVKDYKGEVYFIPGNHDWDRWSRHGWTGVKRQEQFVEAMLEGQNVFLPDSGCPGPVEVHLSDRVVMIIIDTQWWLHKHEKPTGEADGCTVSNEVDFIAELSNLIADNSDKEVIVAGHHPIFTNGNHGGYYSLREHVFPLTVLSPSLYVPLPIIGSLYPVGRRFISHIQDIHHPKYQLLNKRLLETFASHDDLVYAAGHEHSLQYFTREQQHYVVSGSGSSSTYVAKRKKSEFTYGKQGFSKLVYLESGEVWIEFWAVTDSMQGPGELVFRNRIKERDAVKASEEIVDYSDSTITVAAGEIYRAGGFKQLFFGKHYRDAWVAPIGVQVFDLGTEKGGLNPIKLGGGLQTKSLRLRNEEKQEFVFRSIQKYPRKILPEELRETLAGDVLQDQISVAHPYGALVIPGLAEAAGVYHKRSVLTFVPDDPRLGKYRSVYKNTLALFEERASKNLENYANFGFATKAIGTPDLINKMHKNNDHVVDERMLLRTRLFDMWVGDWDRHDDQWRWAVTGSDKIYQPIPRDRDQVFVQFDGIFPWLARRKWASPRFAHFDHEVENLEGLNINGRMVDQKFLTRMTEADWVSTAEDLQRVLVDDAIRAAFEVWPDTIFKLNGEEIIGKLMTRRGDLVDYARQYYRMLAKDVEVVGSNKKETFEIIRGVDGNTLVRVYRKGDRTKPDALYYERTFNRDETKEIRLYGMGGKDEFRLSGAGNRGILVRVIGGKGEDQVVDSSSVRGLRKLTHVYDKRKGMKIQSIGETRDRTSADKEVNSYVRKKHTPNVVAPVFRFGYNIDDGILLGGGVAITTHAWRRSPSAHHKIAGAIAARTAAFVFEYEADFHKAFGKWDLHLQSDVSVPKSATNFYGLGNETSVDSTDANYYLVRFNQVTSNIGVHRRIGETHEFSVGPVHEYVQVERTEDRFVSSADAALPTVAFDATQLIGLQGEYSLNTTDNSALPTRGIKWSTKGSWLYDLARSTVQPRLQSELSLFLSLTTALKPTIAARFGGATVWNNFEFHQANTLGAEAKHMKVGNLRGFPRDRFSGRSVAFQNTELRLVLFTLNSYVVPVQFGVLGFIDHGRVWIDNEDSNMWHRSFGGGIWLSPLQLLALNATYECSDENEALNIRMSFLF